MIIESVKTILGEALATQVETALKGKGKEGKDLDLVVGNDGTYVPVGKYEEEKGKASSADKTLKAAADALKAIGGTGDPAKLADDVKTAQNTMNTLQTNHQAEIKKIQKNTALRMALSEKVHDPNDIISILDIEKIDVDDAGTLKTNVDDLLKPLQESKPYLFKEKGQEGTPIKGAKTADLGGKQEPAVKVDGPVVI